MTKSNLAVCPLTKYPAPGLIYCSQYTDRSTCASCPAWGWRAWLVLIRQHLAAVLSHLLPALLIPTALLMTTTSCGGMAHNANHFSISIAGDIAAGLAGGTYYATADYSRVTWTDGRVFAVFVDGVLRTMYEVSAHGVVSVERTTRYALADATKHGATLVSAVRATQHLSQLRALGVAAGAWMVVGSSGLLSGAVLCGLYPQLAAGVIECAPLEKM